MKGKKWIALVLSVLLCCGIAAGCNDKGVETAYKLTYYDGSGEADFDPALFYQNELTMKGADPSIIWVSEEQDAVNGGYFYMYPTSDYDYGTNAFAVYRSKDLHNWVNMGCAYRPPQGSWAKTRLYAPECVYDATTGKYYLFFSAAGYDRDNLYFDSVAAIREYRSVRDTVNALNVSELDGLQTEIENARTAFADAEGPITVNDKAYSAAGVARVNSALGTYDILMAQIKDMNEGAAKNDRTLAAVKACVIGLRTAHLEQMYYNNDYSIGLAIADSPMGPFVQYTNAADNGLRKIDIGTPFIATEDFRERTTDETAKAGLLDIMTAIDVHPFVDKDGNKYLYYSATTDEEQNTAQHYIYATKIGGAQDPWNSDPDFNTTTRLTQYRYKTVDDDSRANRSDYIYNDDIEEAPFVYYDETSGKYILTFSINGCFDKTYAVAQAIGDSPLGPFTKIDRKHGGMVISTDATWDHVGGPGHHCFVRYGDKLYIAYQGSWNPNPEGKTTQRGVCVDEVHVITNDDGQRVLYANGPSLAPMPKIGPDAEYRNIAGEATVSATGVADGSDKALLTDGLIPYARDESIVKAFRSSGSTTVTLDFGEYRTVRAVQIFNGKDLGDVFEKVDRIEFDFTYTKEDGETVEDTAYIQDVLFDADRYTTHWDGKFADTVRPGGSVTVEFAERKVKCIRITINAGRAFDVSEIFVLGK